MYIYEYITLTLMPELFAGHIWYITFSYSTIHKLYTYFYVVLQYHPQMVYLFLCCITVPSTNGIPISMFIKNIYMYITNLGIY